MEILQKEIALKREELKNTPVNNDASRRKVINNLKFEIEKLEADILALKTVEIGDNELKEIVIEAASSDRLPHERLMEDATFDRISEVSDIIESIFEAMPMIVIQLYNNRKMGLMN